MDRYEIIVLIKDLKRGRLLINEKLYTPKKSKIYYALINSGIKYLNPSRIFALRAKKKAKATAAGVQLELFMQQPEYSKIEEFGKIKNCTPTEIENLTCVYFSKPFTRESIALNRGKTRSTMDTQLPVLNRKFGVSTDYELKEAIKTYIVNHPTFQFFIALAFDTFMV